MVGSAKDHKEFFFKYIRNKRNPNNDTGLLLDREGKILKMMQKREKCSIKISVLHLEISSTMYRKNTHTQMISGLE